MAPNPVPTAASGPALLDDAAWIDANWMFISLGICPVALALLFTLFKGSLNEKFADLLLVGWLAVPIYCLHQAEEHGYDMRGWRYAFVPSFNHGTGGQLFPVCDELSHLTCPLTVRVTTYINTLVVWVGFSLTMVVAHQLGGAYKLAGLFNWGTATVNGLGGHILPMVLTQQYNPGVMQSLFMVPIGIYFMTRQGCKYFAFCMFYGVLAHIIMFAVGINLIYRAGAPDVLEAILCTVASCPLPLLFARCVGMPAKRWESLSDGDESA